MGFSKLFTSARWYIRSNYRLAQRCYSSEVDKTKHGDNANKTSDEPLEANKKTPSTISKNNQKSELLSANEDGDKKCSSKINLSTESASELVLGKASTATDASHTKSNYHKIPQRAYSVSSGDEKCNQPIDKDKRGLVLGVYECNKMLELTVAAQEVDAISGGKISRYLNELSNELKLGKAFIATDVLPEYAAVAIACLGPKSPGYNILEEIDETKENVRWAAGAGVSLLRRRGCAHVTVDAAGVPQAAAEGAELAAWSFQEFKSCVNRTPIPTTSMYGSSGNYSWDVGYIYARAQNWARYLSDMPANKMMPVDFAQATLDMLCPLGVQVNAHDRDWISTSNMQAFMAVARGSCQTPIFLECIYDGTKAKGGPVLIAAKGVTFDSGGICLKDSDSMVENRGSMAGAAVAVAVIRILAELKVPINVRAVIPLCENMISGQCMKVGDVVRALNGTSIQIEDTDMEGRLMLADALVYGQSVHRPALVLDIATLTQGVLLATGGGAFGCFTNCDKLWCSIKSAGASTGDRPWRFPLWNYYKNQITNDPCVDLRNKGSGSATPCIGAAFLKNFVCGDWLHLDITGVGKLPHSDAPPYLSPNRMAARPTRTVAQTLIDIVGNSDAENPKEQKC